MFFCLVSLSITKLYDYISGSGKAGSMVGAMRTNDCSLDPVATYRNGSVSDIQIISSRKHGKLCMQDGDHFFFLNLSRHNNKL